MNDIRLFDAFLAPQKYNDGGAAGDLTADKAAGSIVRGLSRTVGNEIDEFVVDSVRNSDFPMVQVLAMVIAAVYVGVNLIADILSILFTPRARTAISS